MNQKLKAFIDSKYGHLLFLGVALFAGAFAQNLKDQPDFLSALFTWNTANLVADLKMAAAFGLTALVGWLKTDPWTTAAAKVAAARKVPTVPPMALLCLLLMGCISVTPTVAVTPENSAKISSCESTATLHNGFVLGGIGVGAISAGMAGVAAAEPGNKGLQQGMAVGAAAAAGVAALAAGGAGLTAASFTGNRCTDVTTPLPMKPNPTVAILPSFSEM
jgi:hypothetical protein